MLDEPGFGIVGPFLGDFLNLGLLLLGDFFHTSAYYTGLFR